MVLPEDTNLETTFLLLTVKDKCLMGEGIFLGESLLPLKNIQKNNSNVNFKVNFIIMINIGTNNFILKSLRETRKFDISYNNFRMFLKYSLHCVALVKITKMFYLLYKQDFQ